ncbi:MAG: hypothetical protein J5486_00620 [Bacteroidaceae bacterium]|nr:hypothetical protein [Bacteroidaceae bacterium]
MKRITIYILAWTFALSMSAQEQNVGEKLAATPSLSVFSSLVEACDLQAELAKYNDEEYERLYQAGTFPVEEYSSIHGFKLYSPQHRRYGYTVFAETDSFYERAIGKTASSITTDDVRAWIASNGWYAGSDDALQQFVCYHILPVSLDSAHLVIHYNELGYNRNDSLPVPTVFTSEHYETLNEGRFLLQLSEGGGVDGIYLNRRPVLDNGMRGTYYEQGTPLVEGIAVDASKAITSLNGYIYPIDDALVYTDEVKTKVLGGRIRYDLASLFPELINGGYRLNLDKTAIQRNLLIPASSEYQYFDNLWIADGCSFCYLDGYDKNWLNYQGDEFNVTGHYDFTFRLPPVPTDGVYELRVATQNNNQRRSVAHFSIGHDRNNLVATGLPVDMRLGGIYWRDYIHSISSHLGWAVDTDDDAMNRLMDLRLREKGYMKAPNHYSQRPENASVRNHGDGLRRVLWRGEVKAGETLYLRLQDMLGRGFENYQCYLDYVEWCPVSVCDNPDVPEDIW